MYVPSPPRWFQHMAALCGKVILYYADMAKDVLLSYQMWILAGFTLYIKGKMFDAEHEPDVARQFTVNIVSVVLLSMFLTEALNFLILVNHPHFKLMGREKWILLAFVPAAKGYVLYYETKLKIEMDKILFSIIDLVKPSKSASNGVSKKVEAIHHQQLKKAEDLLMRYVCVGG